MRWIFLVNLARFLTQAEKLGIPLIMFCFYRSPADQKKEYEAGRSRTLWGKHQGWLAVDVAIWDDKDLDLIVDVDEIRWKNDDRYSTLGVYWEFLGGVWGGRWKDPVDPYHFEVGPKMTL